MGHDSGQHSEYYDAMLDLLEWLWGKDFMAPGGEGNIRRMMRGIDTRGRRLLDIGSGLGGPAFVLARDFGAEVIGIDLERHLVERARLRAVELGLGSRVRFEHVALGPLPFRDSAFDIVFTSGALTQTEDKAGILSECLRLLAPGGVLTVYDWLKSPGELSDDMLYFYQMEGLTYNMVTLEELREAAEDAGFEILACEDASGWYQLECRREYELLRGDAYDRVVGMIGKKDADHLIEDWRSMVVVCEKGEMRQGYLQARKPASKFPGSG